MSRIRHNTPCIGQRIAAAREISRMAERLPSPGVECTRTTLGERLGIAALYGGKGEADSARAAALLAVAGVADSTANRARVLGAFDGIRAAVHAAVREVH